MNFSDELSSGYKSNLGLSKSSTVPTLKAVSFSSMILSL